MERTSLPILVMATQEQEVFRLLNTMRQCPEEFAGMCSGVKTPRLVTEVVKALKPVTRLHISTGLSCAARDVACYLRTFGFIAVMGGEPVSFPFLSKYGQFKGPVLENFAYRFSTPLEALLQILGSMTPEIHGAKTQLTNPSAHVIGLAAARHSTEQTCLVLIICSSFFDREGEPGHLPLTKAPSEFFPARIAKRVMKSKAQREGLEGGKKFWDYLDRNSIKPAFFFQTESSEPLTVQKIQRLLYGLRFLSDNQVKWLVGELCGSVTTELVNPRQLEAAMLRLKAASTLSTDTQRALIRLRKFIQESLRMSLLEVFSQMSPSGADLSKDDLKEGFARLNITFPASESTLIFSALKVDEGNLSPDNWVRTLCGATLPIDERKASPERTSTALKPILLGTSPDPRYTPFLNASSRPITAANLLAISGRPMLRKAVAEESDCVSSTHWSETSSVKSPDDLPTLVSAPPGRKLIEAARLFTNTAELGETKLVLKEMRSLGTHAYSGPGRHHEVLGEVEEGGVVKVLEINGVWAKVLCGLYEGWVPLCKLDEEVERRLYSRHDNRLRPTETRQLGALSQLYVRKEPDWSSKALTKIGAGRMTEVVGANSQWVKVECESGERGWIPLQHTSISTTGLTFEKEMGATWSPGPSVSHDLFEDYDRKNEAFLSVPVLPRASVDSLKHTVQQKMVGLSLQYQSFLQAKLDRLQYRQRVVTNWLKLELSQAFHQWRKRAASISKYDRFVQKRLEEMQMNYLNSALVLQTRKEDMRLRAVRSATELRLTLKQQEQDLRASRERESNLLRMRAERLHTQKKSVLQASLKPRAKDSIA